MRALGKVLGPLIAVMPVVGLADSPRVVADIAPVHSLVAQIMDGVGVPDLLLPASVSPHDYTMRPSDARVVQDAEVIFWVGNALTPWLEDTLDTLAEDALTVGLLDVEGTLRLDFREGAVFAAAMDEHEHAHEHQHDHKSSDDNDHEHDHEHFGVDPHAWLDPKNASIWLSAIATKLSRVDPENEAIYAKNLLKALAGIEELTVRLQKDLEPMSNVRFVVLHDGYRYFEDRFGLRAIGALSESDASSPGAGRVREIQRAIKESEVTCLFTEVQISAPLLDMIASETNVKVVTLDPLGATLTPGIDLYENKMLNMVQSFKDCA